MMITANNEGYQLLPFGNLHYGRKNQQQTEAFFCANPLFGSPRYFTLNNQPIAPQYENTRRDS